MTDVEIYHNPRCSKSRQTLKLIQDQGFEPKIILYLEDPPNPAQIKDLLGKLDLGAEQLIRTKESIFKELDLKGKKEADLIQAMSKHPILIERPIVARGEKARLGRPPEQVMDLL